MVASHKEKLIDELYTIRGKAEIVDSAIVTMPPDGGLFSRVRGLLFAALLNYGRSSGYGIALPGNAAYLVDLPKRGSFCPDVSYTIGQVLDQNFVNGAPIFAAEVRSKNDYGPKADRAMRAKIADYFAAGTLVVWDVDAMQDKTIRVYRADRPDKPTVYGIDDTAEAEPAVPGWRVAVNELLA